MNQSNLQAAILSMSLDRSSKLSLQQQLMQSLRSLVHRKILVSGNKLPPSRVLADELSVSRTTVTAAYDQLMAEGYLDGRRGRVCMSPAICPITRWWRLKNSHHLRTTPHQSMQSGRLAPVCQTSRRFRTKYGRASWMRRQHRRRVGCMGMLIRLAGGLYAVQ
ncbi:MAG TPA: hypothetical protein DD979_15705 [Gammaproteobacteria bacterium]|nr:hypothetical protein [Gammaproteobacteria bacterium]